MSIIQINHLSYELEANRTLFSEFSIGLSNEKTGLVGKNGTGKSTLARIIMGKITPTNGSVVRSGRIAYLPQTTPVDSSITVAALLEIEEKLNALEQYDSGKGDDAKLLSIINDDWDVRERAVGVLHSVGLERLQLERSTENLSGGEITQLLLAKLVLSDPDYLILDEPTNNLDIHARKKLYAFIKNWKKGLLVISHDRELLSLMDQILEMTTIGVNLYGGNYTFYEAKRREELLAIEEEYESSKRELKKTEKSINAKKDLKEKRDRAAAKRSKLQGLSKLQRDEAKERASQTDGRLRISHESQLKEAQERKQKAWEQVELSSSLNLDLSNTAIPNGKEVLIIENLSFTYDPEIKPILKGINLTMIGPERIALTGDNGSGKSTLIKLIMGKLTPNEGVIKIGVDRVSYLDQHHEGLKRGLTVLENFRRYNPELSETEASTSIHNY